mmetsp:Transcript_28508/g.83366  ORF Transcript_28508/g.83366 Transcript_28508/m.83366 type:complete len:290 (+) Transcript_28508:1549-2418(+)
MPRHRAPENPTTAHSLGHHPGHPGCRPRCPRSPQSTAPKDHPTPPPTPRARAGPPRRAPSSPCRPWPREPQPPLPPPRPLRQHGPQPSSQAPRAPGPRVPAPAPPPRATRRIAPGRSVVPAPALARRASPTPLPAPEEMPAWRRPGPGSGMTTRRLVRPPLRRHPQVSPRRLGRHQCLPGAHTPCPARSPGPQLRCAAPPAAQSLHAPSQESWACRVRPTAPPPAAGALSHPPAAREALQEERRGKNAEAPTWSCAAQLSPPQRRRHCGIRRRREKTSSAGDEGPRCPG